MSLNGYRALDLERVFALVFILAGKCKELYWTMLQKAAFFADMAYFERTGQSLTGLAYVHATYGPVIDRKEEVRFVLSERGIVGFQERGIGEIIVPLSFDGAPFTADEVSFIGEIAEFVNTFSSATDLSEYSHNLACWTCSVDGEAIQYPSSGGEVARAVAERLKAIR